MQKKKKTWIPAFAGMTDTTTKTVQLEVKWMWIKPRATHAEEANVSKIVSLVVKGFALVFVLTLDKQNAINFQLLGGIWILQTFPSIVFGPGCIDQAHTCDEWLPLNELEQASEALYQFARRGL